ncbi:gag-protease polyprotein, related [Cucumis melo var. makuwa]|uniref:Gag-protease polyprotein, related n=1 Tax=Cucumis melo var. makuwa TaxID=1194695 RepID=A0A5A7V6M9_CUCMM|nr:gag-protease polyprotein, related [Cucumis melo var. makuwa]TYK31516.1 gag-protease polyprotein, related [Cucumis melo var. makuwa]
MKVTTIEEAHDITKLKLDELFGSLVTFEMAISHRENKKGKGIAFTSIYEEETIVNQFDNEANMNESIALLMKQFSKVVKKFKNLNTTESNAKNLTNYRRREMVNAIPEGLMKSLTGGLVTMDEKRMVKEEFSDVENVGELVIIMLNVLRS